MTEVVLPDDIKDLVQHMLQHYLAYWLQDSHCPDKWHYRNWTEAEAKIIKMFEQK